MLEGQGQEFDFVVRFLECSVCYVFNLDTMQTESDHAHALIPVTSALMICENIRKKRVSREFLPPYQTGVCVVKKHTCAVAT